MASFVQALATQQARRTLWRNATSGILEDSTPNSSDPWQRADQRAESSTSTAQDSKAGPPTPSYTQLQVAEILRRRYPTAAHLARKGRGRSRSQGGPYRNPEPWSSHRKGAKARAEAAAGSGAGQAPTPRQPTLPAPRGQPTGRAAGAPSADPLATSDETQDAERHVASFLAWTKTVRSNLQTHRRPVFSALTLHRAHDLLARCAAALGMKTPLAASAPERPDAAAAAVAPGDAHGVAAACSGSGDQEDLLARGRTVREALEAVAVADRRFDLLQLRTVQLTIQNADREISLGDMGAGMQDLRRLIQKLRNGLQASPPWSDLLGLANRNVAKRKMMELAGGVSPEVGSEAVAPLQFLKIALGGLALVSRESLFTDELDPITCATLAVLQELCRCMSAEDLDSLRQQRPSAETTPARSVLHCLALSTEPSGPGTVHSVPLDNLSLLQFYDIIRYARHKREVAGGPQEDCLSAEYLKDVFALMRPGVWQLALAEMRLLRLLESLAAGELAGSHGERQQGGARGGSAPTGNGINEHVLRDVAFDVLACKALLRAEQGGKQDQYEDKGVPAQVGLAGRSGADALPEPNGRAAMEKGAQSYDGLRPEVVPASGAPSSSGSGGGPRDTVAAAQEQQPLPLLPRPQTPPTPPRPARQQPGPLQQGLRPNGSASGSHSAAATAAGGPRATASRTAGRRFGMYDLLYSTVPTAQQRATSAARAGGAAAAGVGGGGKMATAANGRIPRKEEEEEEEEEEGADGERAGHAMGHVCRALSRLRAFGLLDELPYDKLYVDAVQDMLRAGCRHFISVLRSALPSPSPSSASSASASGSPISTGCCPPEPPAGTATISGTSTGTSSGTGIEHGTMAAAPQPDGDARSRVLGSSSPYLASAASPSPPCGASATPCSPHQHQQLQPCWLLPLSTRLVRPLLRVQGLGESKGITLDLRSALFITTRWARDTDCQKQASRRRPPHANMLAELERAARGPAGASYWAASDPLAVVKMAEKMAHEQPALRGVSWRELVKRAPVDVEAMEVLRLALIGVMLGKDECLALELRLSYCTASGALYDWIKRNPQAESLGSPEWYATAFFSALRFFAWLRHVPPEHGWVGNPTDAPSAAAPTTSDASTAPTTSDASAAPTTSASASALVGAPAPAPAPAAMTPSSPAAAEGAAASPNLRARHEGSIAPASAPPAAVPGAEPLTEMELHDPRRQALLYAELRSHVRRFFGLSDGLQNLITRATYDMYAIRCAMRSRSRGERFPCEPDVPVEPASQAASGSHGDIRTWETWLLHLHSGLQKQGYFMALVSCFCTTTRAASDSEDEDAESGGEAAAEAGSRGVPEPQPGTPGAVVAAAAAGPGHAGVDGAADRALEGPAAGRDQGRETERQQPREERRSQLARREDDDETDLDFSPVLKVVAGINKYQRLAAQDGSGDLRKRMGEDAGERGAGVALEPGERGLRRDGPGAGRDCQSANGAVRGLRSGFFGPARHEARTELESLTLDALEDEESGGGGGGGGSSTDAGRTSTSSGTSTSGGMDSPGSRGRWGHMAAAERCVTFGPASRADDLLRALKSTCEAFLAAGVADSLQLRDPDPNPRDGGNAGLPLHSRRPGQRFPRVEVRVLGDEHLALFLLLTAVMSEMDLLLLQPLDVGQTQQAASAFAAAAATAAKGRRGVGKDGGARGSASEGATSGPALGPALGGSVAGAGDGVRLCLQPQASDPQVERDRCCQQTGGQGSRPDFMFCRTEPELSMLFKMRSTAPAVTLTANTKLSDGVKALRKVMLDEQKGFCIATCKGVGGMVRAVHVMGQVRGEMLAKGRDLCMVVAGVCTDRVKEMEDEEEKLLRRRRRRQEHQQQQQSRHRHEQEAGDAGGDAPEPAAGERPASSLVFWLKRIVADALAVRDDDMPGDIERGNGAGDSDSGAGGLDSPALDHDTNSSSGSGSSGGVISRQRHLRIGLQDGTEAVPYAAQEHIATLLELLQRPSGSLRDGLVLQVFVLECDPRCPQRWAVTVVDACRLVAAKLRAKARELEMANALRE